MEMEHPYPNNYSLFLQLQSKNENERHHANSYLLTLKKEPLERTIKLYREVIEGKEEKSSKLSMKLDKNYSKVTSNSNQEISTKCNNGFITRNILASNIALTYFRQIYLADKEWMSLLNLDISNHICEMFENFRFGDKEIGYLNKLAEIISIFYCHSGTANHDTIKKWSLAKDIKVKLFSAILVKETLKQNELTGGGPIIPTEEILKFVEKFLDSLSICLMVESIEIVYEMLRQGLIYEGVVSRLGNSIIQTAIICINQSASMQNSSCELMKYYNSEKYLRTVSSIFQLTATEWVSRISDLLKFTIEVIESPEIELKIKELCIEIILVLSASNSKSFETNSEFKNNFIRKLIKSCVEVEIKPQITNEKVSNQESSDNQFTNIRRNPLAANYQFNIEPLDFGHRQFTSDLLNLDNQFAPEYNSIGSPINENTHMNLSIENHHLLQSQNDYDSDLENHFTIDRQISPHTVSPIDVDYEWTVSHDSADLSQKTLHNSIIEAFRILSKNLGPNFINYYMKSLQDDSEPIDLNNDIALFSVMMSISAIIEELIVSKRKSNDNLNCY